MRNLSKRTTIGLGLFLFIALLGVIDSLAATSLRTVHIPHTGAYANSQSFRSSDGGVLRATVLIRAKSILANLPGSRFQVQLMKGSQVIQNKIVITQGVSYKTVRFGYSVACSRARATYYFRIRNITAGPVKLPGEAKFPKVEAPALASPKSKTISSWTVVNRRNVKYTIPGYMEPTGRGGKFEFDLNWMTTCRNNNARNCKIKFVLKQNGRTMREYESTSRGRLRFSYIARPGKNWTLEATGLSLKATQRVQGTIKMTPRGVCG
ncbi:MAG: hypothetical protein HKN25_06330 [Pyrinomonadaceae bacterium]|nr:hypothetical protein [Pyrinomonadaceae bacterium]